MEAAVEALENGWRVEEVPVPSRFCLDLLNEELRMQIEAGRDGYGPGGMKRSSDCIREVVMGYERGNVAKSVMDFRPFLDRIFLEGSNCKYPSDRHHYRMNTRRVSFSVGVW